MISKIFRDFKIFDDFGRFSRFLMIFDDFQDCSCFFQDFCFSEDRFKKKWINKRGPNILLKK